MADERLSAQERTEQLTRAGYKIARTKGIRKVTRAAVARDTKVSDGLINRYFDGRDGLRMAVLEHAVTQKDAKTLADAAQHYELPAMSKVLAAEVKRLSV